MLVVAQIPAAVSEFIKNKHSNWTIFLQLKTLLALLEITSPTIKIPRTKSGFLEVMMSNGPYAVKISNGTDFQTRKNGQFSIDHLMSIKFNIKNSRG